MIEKKYMPAWIALNYCYNQAGWCINSTDAYITIYSIRTIVIFYVSEKGMFTIVIFRWVTTYRAI